MADMTTYQRRVNLAADRMEARVPRIAAMQSPEMDSTKLTPDKERMLFWTRDPNADEQSLWREVEIAAQQMGMPIEQAYATAEPNIAKALYPKRLGVIRAGDRVNDTSKQIRFMKRMLEQGPPEDVPQ